MALRKLIIRVNLKILVSFNIDISFNLFECVSMRASKGMLEMTSIINLPFKTYFFAIMRASFISIFVVSSIIVVRKFTSTSNANNMSMIQLIALYAVEFKSGGLNAI